MNKYGYKRNGKPYKKGENKPIFCEKCGSEMEYTPTLGYNCTSQQCIKKF